MKTLLVSGGRDQDNRNWVYCTLDTAATMGGFDKIICGYNPKDKRFQGADQLAYEWAQAEDFPCEVFPADWTKFGRSAGPRRNAQMVATKPDEALGFPRKDGTWGAGTLDCLGKAAGAGIAVSHAT